MVLGLPQRFSDHYFRAVSGMISRHATRLPVAAINAGGLFQQLSGNGLPVALGPDRFNSSRAGHTSASSGRTAGWLRQEPSKVRVYFDALIDADGCHPRPLAHALIAEAVACLLLQRTGFKSNVNPIATSATARAADDRGATRKRDATQRGDRRRAEQRASLAALSSAARERRKSRTDTASSERYQAQPNGFFPLFSSAHCCRGGAASLAIPVSWNKPSNASGIPAMRSGIASRTTQAQCEEICSSMQKCLFYSYAVSSGTCSLCSSCSRYVR